MADFNKALLIAEVINPVSTYLHRNIRCNIYPSPPSLQLFAVRTMSAKWHAFYERPNLICAAGLSGQELIMAATMIKFLSSQTVSFAASVHASSAKKRTMLLGKVLRAQGKVKHLHLAYFLLNNNDTCLGALMFALHCVIIGLCFQTGPRLTVGSQQSTAYWGRIVYTFN